VEKKKRKAGKKKRAVEKVKKAELPFTLVAEIFCLLL